MLGVFDAWIGGESPVDGSEYWTSKLTIQHKKIGYDYNGKGKDFCAAYDNAANQALFQFYGLYP